MPRSRNHPKGVASARGDAAGGSLAPAPPAESTRIPRAPAVVTCSAPAGCGLTGVSGSACPSRPPRCWVQVRSRDDKTQFWNVVPTDTLFSGWLWPGKHTALEGPDCRPRRRQRSEVRAGEGREKVGPWYVIWTAGSRLARSQQPWTSRLPGSKFIVLF